MLENEHLFSFTKGNGYKDMENLKNGGNEITVLVQQ